MSLAETMERRAEEFKQRYTAIQEQIGRVIVGHDEIVHGVLTCLFVGGHCLLEGVPGLGKTLLVRTLAQVLDLDFSRIQFTPDLMPADILGTNMVMETIEGKRFFEFQRGPIFTQICLADEINRATPKTQSAMLETRQEGAVTAAGTRYQLKRPFLVMATQNPIEQEGPTPCRKPSSTDSCSSCSSAIRIATSLRQSSTAPRGTRRSNRRRSWTGKKSSAGRVLCARSSWPTTCATTWFAWCSRPTPRASTPCPRRTSSSAGASPRAAQGAAHWPPRSGCSTAVTT